MCTYIAYIVYLCIESSRRKGELMDKEKEEDFDADKAEFMREEIEQEENVSRTVGYLLLSLVHKIKAAFIPFYDELSSYLMPIKGKDKTAEEKIMCTNVFHAVVVQCNKEAAIKYYDIYPFLLEWSNDENPKVRERALYGLGLCAQYGSFLFRQFIKEALPRINEVITHVYARELENERAFDYAVSALGKIFNFHWECIDSVQKIIPVWLNCMPIRVDMIEAMSVHGNLCFMVERLDKELLGPKYEHFPRIILVFAEVLFNRKDLALEDTANHMIYVLRNLEKTLPPTTWASAWSLLLPHQELELESILSPEEDANFSSVQ